MYVSLYDLAQEFDVSELQLKMGLSRLVQVGPIWPLYSSYIAPI